MYVTEEEQAVSFCDQRKAEIDKWVSKETNLSMVSVAYWYWVGKDQHRIFVSSETLVAAVSQCKKLEEDAIQESSKSNKTQPGKM